MNFWDQLKYFITPEEAEAKVTFKDPESAKTGKWIAEQQNPSYAQRIARDVLKTAQDHPENVNVYGPYAKRSQEYWGDPRYPQRQDEIANYWPRLGQILLSRRGRTPYALTHELIHFLQKKFLPNLPEDVNLEDVPFILMGTERYPVQGNINPIDEEIYREKLLNRQRNQQSYETLFDFYRRIFPEFTTPEALKEPK